MLNHDFDDRIKNGTDRRKLTTCMEWNKLHLQECSQDKERNGAERSKQENRVFLNHDIDDRKERNGAERNGENLQLVWNGINCISKNVHRIKNGTERNEMEKTYKLYGME